TRPIGWPPELVVDQPERPVLEEIDPVRLAAQPDATIFIADAERELALERMLQQPLDNARGPLGFHAKDSFAKTGRSRRPEQARPLETAFGFRQRRDIAFDNVREERACSLEVRVRDRRVTGRLPLAEEVLEHLMNQLPLPARIHHLFVVRLLFELEHV